MKRILDILVSFFGLLALSPLLVIVMVLIWLKDFHSPFYIAPRVGKKERIFQMIKLRSMVINADKSGVDSTSGKDPRITAIGRFVRKFKLDEFAQLWNVLLGDMSLVGPRPNVKRETDLYTDEEKKLLSIKPGITDISSIVFSDEGDILADKEDPDLAYNQLIRPWKSRLGIIYVDRCSIWLDIQLIILTVIAIISRAKALAGVNRLLNSLNVSPSIIKVAERDENLTPFPPPGSDHIVSTR